MTRRLSLQAKWLRTVGLVAWASEHLQQAQGFSICYHYSHRSEAAVAPVTWQAAKCSPGRSALDLRLGTLRL